MCSRASKIDKKRLFYGGSITWKRINKTKLSNFLVSSSELSVLRELSTCNLCCFYRPFSPDVQTFSFFSVLPSWWWLMEQIESPFAFLYLPILAMKKYFLLRVSCSLPVVTSIRASPAGPLARWTVDCTGANCWGDQLQSMRASVQEGSWAIGLARIDGPRARGGHLQRWSCSHRLVAY